MTLNTATSIRRLLLLLLILFTLIGTAESARTKRRATPSGHKKKLEDHDYYGILGVSKSASAKQIKSKYRKLALKYHPDKVSEEEREEAAQKMAKINIAYDVLGDEEKRKIFDQYGTDGLNAYEQGQDPRAAGFGSGGFGGGGGGFGGNQFHFQHGGGSGGFRGGGGRDPVADMFEQMFGGGGGSAGGGGFGGPGGGGGQRPPPLDLFPKGSSKVAKLGKPKFPDRKSKNMWLILFYSSRNSGIKETAASLEKLAEKSNLAYKVGAVDCHRGAEDATFCRSKKIDDQRGLPVFSFVVDGKLHMMEGNKRVSPRDLNDFCMEHMPQDMIQNINNLPQLEERILHDNKPALLLLSDKYETSGMYYSLTYQFRNQFLAGESRAKNLKLAQEFAVKKYPQLIAFVPNTFPGAEKFNEQYGILRYMGDPKKDDIMKWLNVVLKKLPKKARSDEL